MAEKRNRGRTRSQYNALCSDLDRNVRNLTGLVNAISASYSRANGVMLPGEELEKVLDLAVAVSGELECVHADLIDFTDRHI